jgi:Ca2+-binding EF-hand superfamily protein
MISTFSYFERYDTDRDKSLNFDELKLMMEKLGIPQTHLSLKDMIKQFDEDHDGKISFREVKKKLI